MTNDEKKAFLKEFQSNIIDLNTRYRSTHISKLLGINRQVFYALVNFCKTKQDIEQLIDVFDSHLTSDPSAKSD